MDKKKLSFLILILVLAALLTGVILFFAFFGKHNPADNPSENTAATDDYDSVICLSLTFGADPTTSVNLTWQSFFASAADVYYCKSADYADFSSLKASGSASVTDETFSIPAAGQKEYKNPTLCEVSGKLYRVHLEGLEPGTKYVYAIGDGETFGELHSFTTMHDGDAFTFALLSDSQGFTASDYEYFGRTISAASKNNPDFYVHMGDAVEDGKNLRQWTSYWASAAGIFENSAVVSVVGNQDKKNTLIHYTYGSADNRTALVSGYFAFTVGNVHFSVLNTGDGDKDLPKAQLKWLKNDLEAAEGLRKIVLIHKAPYSNYNHCLDSEILEIRAQLDTILAEYGVDLVLEGHDHVFYRTAPLINGQNADFSTSDSDGLTMYVRANGGTVFFMNSSSGVKQHSGAALDASVPCEKSSLMKEPTYTLVSVDSEKITFKTYTVSSDGTEELFDAFGLCW